MVQEPLIVKYLGLQDYEPTWRAMREFTDTRDSATPDELWLLEHKPVFTQGQAGKVEHILSFDHDIPVVQSDRGGQITYHGPGQLVVYTLIDLKRRKLGVRGLVDIVETTVVKLLAEHNVLSQARPDAPGVYVDDRKIASLGLRVRKGCSFHGVAINCAMDLTPFLTINPCGYPGMEMVQLQDLLDPDSMPTMQVLGEQFVQHFRDVLHPLSDS